MYCDCCGDGLIEVKCPYSVKDGKPEDVIGKKGSFFNNSVLHSDSEVSGSDFCDFVVWTQNAILRDYTRIHSLTKNLKLSSFYIEKHNYCIETTVCKNLVSITNSLSRNPL